MDRGFPADPNEMLNWIKRIYNNKRWVYSDIKNPPVADTTRRFSVDPNKVYIYQYNNLCVVYQLNNVTTRGF